MATHPGLQALLGARVRGVQLDEGEFQLLAHEVRGGGFPDARRPGQECGLEQRSVVVSATGEAHGGGALLALIHVMVPRAQPVEQPVRTAARRLLPDQLFQASRPVLLHPQLPVAARCARGRQHLDF